MILHQIMAHKRHEVEVQKRHLPLAELETQVADQAPARDFAAALARPGVRLIAEVKKASPSKGLLCPNFHPVDLARTYELYGAAAISVLTDQRFFQGELDYLSQIKQAVGLPVLRKDFIFDAYQIYQSRAAGADALLLIAAVLSDSEIQELLELTHQLGMQALIETHDEGEVKRVLPLNPCVMGINNRNLVDFTVDLDNFGRLRSLLPAETIAVAESGVHSAADVQRLTQMRADAILVGEALVTAPNTAAKVRELANGSKP